MELKYNRKRKLGDVEYEGLLPGDEVFYAGKHYWVSTAHYIANDGMQVVSLIRMADIESNRSRRDSIKARANECRILIDRSDDVCEQMAMYWNFLQGQEFIAKMREFNIEVL